MNYLCKQPPRIFRFNRSGIATGPVYTRSTCRQLVLFLMRAVNRPTRRRASLNLERHLFVTNRGPFFVPCTSSFKKLWNAFNQRLPRLSILRGLPTCYVRCQ